MALLELDRVAKRFRRGSRVVLADVSLQIGAGEMVVVWGERMSGRSTLLRVAAGIETPDAGVVYFDGQRLTGPGGEPAGGISYVRRRMRSQWGRTVLDELVAVCLARNVARSDALQVAWKALQRVQAESCGTLEPAELKIEETVRVVIARALTASPRLILIDEPTAGVDTLRQDGILELLRSLADEGIAVLASTGEGTGFLGADRALALHNGRLQGDLRLELASVSDLALRRRARR